MQPGQIAIGIQPGRTACVLNRTKEIMTQVFLARPQHLDRCSRWQLLGDQRGLAHKILIAAAPAETAAEVHFVHFALIERYARRLRQCGHRCLGILRSHPALGLRRRQAHGGVHRLHAYMRNKRHFVDRFELRGRTGDGLYCITIVGVGKHVFVAGQACRQVLHDVAVLHARIGAFVPYLGQCFECFLRAPPGVGDDRYGAFIDAQRLRIAGHAGDLGLIKAHQFSTEHGAIHDGRVYHAGQRDVHCVLFAAINLVSRIEALDRFAGNLPLARITQLDRLQVRRRQLGGGIGHLAITSTAARGFVRDHALIHREFTGGHFPFIGGGLHQHDLGGCACAAHIIM